MAKKKFLTVHQCADLIGDFFERAAQALFDGKRGAKFHDIDNESDTWTGACPDIINWKDDRLLEVKAARPGNAFKVCTRQLRCYTALTGGFPFTRGFYVFFRHGLKGVGGRFCNQEELFAALSDNVRECMVMDISVIAALAAEGSHVRHYPNTFYQYPLLMFSGAVVRKLFDDFPIGLFKLGLAQDEFLLFGEQRRVLFYNHQNLPLFAELERKYDFIVPVTYLVKEEHGLF